MTESMDTVGFELSFDPEPSPQSPNGYWYAITKDGSYDADGQTPLDALAKLVNVLHEALMERRSH